jgi:hypothetical protein
MSGEFTCNSTLYDENEEMSYPWSPGEPPPTESDLEDYARSKYQDAENVELHAGYCMRNG